MAREGVHSIVMVTNVLEGSRIKCQMYWPDSGRICCGPFKVTITDQQILADYTTRNLLVEVLLYAYIILNLSQILCSSQGALSVL